MTCQNCGHENSSEARFCASCGNPLTSNVVQPDLRQTERVSGDLQPRDLGDIISETYYVYRNHFKPFLIIASVPQIPLIVASVSLTLVPFYSLCWAFYSFPWQRARQSTPSFSSI